MEFFSDATQKKAAKAYLTLNPDQYLEIKEEISRLLFEYRIKYKSNKYINGSYIVDFLLTDNVNIYLIYIFIEDNTY